jgi:hypothetical protein
MLLLLVYVATLQMQQQTRILYHALTPSPQYHAAN